MDHASAAHFRELADNAPMMIWRSRADGLCDFFNLPWLEFTGRTAEQEHGEGWLDGIHPDDRERCISTYRVAFEARRTFSMEYRLLRADGVYRVVLDNGCPFYRDGAFAGYFGSCIDVTEQRDSGQRLEAALDVSRRLMAEKDELVRELHHRVRNVLQRGLSLLRLSKSDLPARAQGVLEPVDEALKAMALAHSALCDDAVASPVDIADYLGRLAGELALSGFVLELDVASTSRQLPVERVTALGAAVAEALLQLSSASGGAPLRARVLWRAPRLTLEAPGLDETVLVRRAIEANAVQAGAVLRCAADRLDLELKP